MLAKLHIRNSPEKLDGPKKRVLWDDLVNLKTEELHCDVADEKDSCCSNDEVDDEVKVGDTLHSEQIHAELSTPVSNILLSDEENDVREKNVDRNQDQERELQYPGVHYRGYLAPSFIPRRTLTRGSSRGTRTPVDMYSEDEGIGLTPTSFTSGYSHPRCTVSRETTRNSLMSRESYSLASTSFVSRDLGLDTSTVSTPVNEDYLETLHYQDGKFVTPKRDFISKRSLTQTNSAPEISSTAVTPKTFSLNVNKPETIMFGHKPRRKVKSSYGIRNQNKTNVATRPQTVYSTKSRRMSFSKTLYKSPPGSRSVGERSGRYTPNENCWAVKLDPERVLSESKSALDTDNDLFQIKSMFKSEDLRARSFPGTPNGLRKYSAESTRSKQRSDVNLRKAVSTHYAFTASVIIQSFKGAQ